MNKSDKYYLKKGRLELSMLEDEEQIYRTDTENKIEERDLGINLGQVKIEQKSEEDERISSVPQQTLKINKDIYNTLHTMGQFLTTKEHQGNNRSVKKSIKVVKGQKLGKISEISKAQEVEVSTSLPISEADQIKQINEVIYIPSKEKQEVEEKVGLKEAQETLGDTRRIDAAQLEQMAIHLEYRRANKALDENTEIEEQISSAYEQASQFMMACDEVAISIEKPHNIEAIDVENQNHSSGPNIEEIGVLNQNDIDEILSTFFKPMESKNAFCKQLKNHIDRHIMAIKNYNHIL